MPTPTSSILRTKMPMSKFLLLIATWVLFSTSCLAEDKEQNFISKLFPQAVEQTSSVGLIDGKKHLAAIIFNESERLISLVVFELGQDGNYKLRSKSKWFSDHPRWYGLTIKIKNNSVYFELSGNGGCCSDYSSQYQFKPKDGNFELVGVESSETGFESKSDDNGISIDGKYISYRYGSSINYLTGIVSHWRIQAPSSSDAPFKDDISTIKVQKKRVEKRFNFSPPKKVLLEDFDIWDDPEERVEHLSGYFDQRFNYHE